MGGSCGRSWLTVTAETIWVEHEASAAAAGVRADGVGAVVLTLIQPLSALVDI